MFLQLIKSKKKLFLISFASLLGIWILFLVLFPFFLSKGGLCNQLNKQIKGKLLIQKAHLSWFKPQRFKNITLIDPQGHIVFEIASLTTTATLLDFLFDKGNLKEVNIHGLNGQLYTKKDSSSHFISSLDPPFFISEKESLSKKSSVYIFKLPFRGKIHIEDSSIVLKSKGNDPIHFTDIQFNGSLSKHSEPLTAHLACETSQNNLSGFMHLNLELGGFDERQQIIFTPFDRDLFFLSPEGYLNLNAEMTNLPSESLDCLIGHYKPKLNAFFSNIAGGPINCGTDLHLAKNKSKVNFSAHSKDIDFNFCGSLVQNQFLLSEPSTCRFEVKPALVKNLCTIFNIDLPLTLQNQTEASVQIDRLTVPLDLNNFNFSNLSCNAQFCFSPMKFAGEKKKPPFEIEHLKGTIDTFDLNESVTLHLNALAHNQKNPVHFKLDGQFSKLTDPKNELKGIDQIKAQLMAHAKDFPTAILAHFAKEKELALEILGPSINLDSTFYGSFSKADITMNLSSSRVHLPSLTFKLENKNALKLDGPAKVSFRITPNLLTKALKPNFSLLQPIDLKGELSSLEFKKVDRKMALENIDLNVSASPFELFVSNYKPCQVHEAFIQVMRENSQNLLTKFNTEISLPPDLPFYNLEKKCIGYFEVEDLMTYIQNNKGVLSTNLTSNNWTASAKGIINKNWDYELLEDAQIYIDHFHYKIDDQKSIISPKAEISIHPTNITANNFSFEKQDFSGELRFEELSLNNGPFYNQFNTIKIPFAFSTKDNFLKANISSQNKAVYLDVLCHYFSPSSLLDYKNVAYEIEGKFQKVSPNIFKFFTHSTQNFETLFGSEIDLDIQSTLTTKDDINGKIDYSLMSSIIQSKGTFAVGNKLQVLNEGLFIDYFISPASFYALTEALKIPTTKSFLIEEPVSLKMNIKDLNSPFATQNNSKSVSFEGTLQVNKFITNKGSLYDISGNFSSPNLSENLKLNLNAKSTNLSSKEGLFSLSADLTDPLNTDLKTINSKINGLVQCTLENFPTPLISNFWPEENFLTTLLGPQFNLNCMANLKEGQGPLNFQVKSDNLNTEFALDFDQDHLTLHDDLTAQIKLKTNEMNQWIENINPLVNQIEDTNLNASLTIPKKHFHFPVSPFKFNELQIDSATVTLEKIQLKTNSFYSKIFNFLNAPSEKQTTLWMTPTVFSLKNGSLKLHRLDFLLNEKYHLAFWGDYQFKQNQGVYFLSIPKNTLSKLFPIKKLPENYMFQIPLTGPFHKLSADWATATAQLGILTLSSSLQPNESTSRLDDLLEIFSKTQPAGHSPESSFTLPWESPEKISEVDSNSVEKNEETQTEILQSFFKELRKVIKK